jgi:hypothetical protein
MLLTDVTDESTDCDLPDEASRTDPTIHNALRPTLEPVMTTEIDFGKLMTFIRTYCEAYSLPDQSADVLEFVRVDMLMRPDQYVLHRLSAMHVTAARRIRQLAGA